ncbi:MAG: hypothetical protein HC888_03020 [Candidatus Competibacteraceae bacterium]|nr:hypothetical protein [Candidatus Competibacteraceae bacterium]
MNPRFSILVPSIPSRIEKYLTPLFRKLEAQVPDGSVEIISLLDNKTRSVGLKRDALVQAARGDYLAFCDDDDDVSLNYVSSILEAIKANPSVDVIVFKQMSTINGGNPFIVEFGLEYSNEEASLVDGIWRDIRRQPFHICAWRRELAQAHRFPDASYGEDWHWCSRVLSDVKTEARIDDVLHFYRYSDSVTEAEVVFPKD